ncbi:TPA: hypothetical protein ACN1ND_002743 [Enterococcus faecalis]|uniref:hypothetical protein n=1 Tax=Enterococcus faecalis TaxID=1351 RepID=UPI0019F5EF09|nr:hypothetical protein [Enterococcus faecalis]EKJ3581670.1 hypothetical protein [Enterococcus faecalis]EKQ3613720.1 hypothetical protein [Enterococcus faecalis]HCT9166074.1 hypothetical protein [Enterococcus faecalis]
MKKILVILSLVMVAFATFGFGTTSHAAKLDGQNNVITSGRGVTSAMVGGRLFNQYKYQSGTGYVDVTVITYFNRSTGTGPVTVNRVEVKYNNTSNGTPYFSEFFVDKRAGSTTYLKIPAEHKMMKRGANSFTVNVNAANAQSVQLYAHADAYGSGAGNGTRYQYITAFF